jgi:hypothetical protein
MTTTAGHSFYIGPIGSFYTMSSLFIEQDKESNKNSIKKKEIKPFIR